MTPTQPRSTDTNYEAKGVRYWRGYVRLSTGRQMVYGKNYGDWKRKRDKALIDDSKGLISTKDTLGQAFDSWFYSAYHNPSRIKESTFVTREQLYIRHLKSDPIMRVRLSELTEMHIKKFAKRKEDDDCPRGQIQRALAMLKMFSRYCVAEGYLLRNPLRNISAAEWDKPEMNKKEIAVFTDDELRKILECTRDPMYRFLFLFSVMTGARSGELSAANHEDICDGVFHITKTLSRQRKGPGSVTYRSGEEYCIGDTKTKNSRREIPLSDTMQKEYAKYKAWCREEKLRRGKGRLLPEDPLFVTKTYGRIIHAQIGVKLKQACSLGGIEYKTPHTFRHTFITKLAQAGTPIATVMKLAGHSQIGTTLRYYHVELSYKKMALEVLDSVINL